MNLIQFFDINRLRAVGAVEDGLARKVEGAESVYDLAIAAIDQSIGLGEVVAQKGLGLRSSPKAACWRRSIIPIPPISMSPAPASPIWVPPPRATPCTPPTAAPWRRA